MSKLDNQPYRGTRDFKPADMRRQNYIFATWRRVCQQFGYEEYLTPLVEPIELYTAKTSEEIVNEQSYSFTDRGDRQLTIRPEMTPSVARLVSQDRLENGYPLRLFSIANYMRYERPQKGRLREFWQLNADIFGDDGQRGDVEIILLVDALMKAFCENSDKDPEKLYEIRINSRSELIKRIDNVGLKTAHDKVIAIIDRMKKTDRDDLLTRLGEHVEEPDKLLTNLEDGKTEPLKSLTIELHDNHGITVKNDPTIARGFDYYTDMVFEVFDKNSDNNRSLFGGGRYDALLENFGVDPLPTVGFGMGDAVLAEFLDGHDLWPDDIDTPSTQIWITNDSQNARAETVAAQLRGKGLNVAIDYSGRKLGKQIKTADTHGIPYVLFINDDNDKYGLKDLVSGDQQDLTVDEISEHLAN